MPGRIGRFATSLALLVLLAPAPAEAAEVGLTATGTVEALHAAFIQVMKSAERVDFAGRRESLAAPLESAFDFDFMAAKSLGAGGRALGKEDHERWAATFARFIVSSFARRFDDYSGQSYESKGEESVPRGQVVVHTLLVRPSDKDIEFGYRLHSIPDGWKVIDVYMRGTISLLALRRAEFSTALEREGFEALVTSVERHAASDRGSLGDER